jgi:uncharacterized protein (TIGR04255 family)
MSERRTAHLQFCSGSANLSDATDCPQIRRISEYTPRVRPDVANPSVTDHLVTFDNPPVNEVALSVQFARHSLDDAFVLAEFWPRVRDRFPKIERQPPIAPTTEDFAYPPKQGQFQVEFGQQPFPQRYWCTSESGNDLIQFQQDRFLVNWRKLDNGVEYPRYDHVQRLFSEFFPIFQEALSPEELNIEQCEITYVNEVEAKPDSGHGHMELSRVLKLFNAPIELRDLPSPEDTQYQSRYVLRRGEDPYGRFYVSAVPGFSSPANEPIYVVTLLVRGTLPNPGLDGALEFFKDGHDRIVRTFKEITTEDMHAKWRLKPE